MDRQKEFSTIFQRYGKPVQVTALPSDTQSRYKQQIDFYNNFDPSIYTGAVENMGFNAIASKNNTAEYIALYMGSITQLTLYAYQVFSDPELYKDIGDVSVEQCEQNIIDILKEKDILPTSKLRYLPNDPVRRNAAERVAECACLILFLHEAAHIRGCHLDVLLDEIGLSELQEFSMVPINEEESLVMRALELEADSLAIVNSLSIWRYLAKHTGVHEVEVLGPTRSWLIAAELLFWVMCFNHDKSRKDQLASHPSILTRYLNIRLIKRKQEEEDKELADAVKDPECTLLPWIRKHNFSSPILDFYDKPFSENNVAEWAELRKKMESMLPKLEHYQSLRSERLEVKP